MSRDTAVPFRWPDEVDDLLTTALRSGARCLLAQAVKAKAEAFLVATKDKRLADGRERVTRHGHGPERVVQTGIGLVAVQRIKLRYRVAGNESEHICFTPTLLPR